MKPLPATPEILTMAQTDDNQVSLGTAEFSQSKTGFGMGEGPELSEVRPQLRKEIKAFQQEAAKNNVHIVGYHIEYHDQVEDDWICCLIATVSGDAKAVKKIKTKFES